MQTAHGIAAVPYLLSLPAAERLRVASQLSANEALSLVYDWRSWAREKQVAPEGDWTTWLLLCGRGWGKTVTAAQWVREKVMSGQAGNVALIGDTAADVRDVMIEGPRHGLIAVHHPSERPRYQPSRRRLVWPNGAIATAYAAEAPESLRGPEHDLAWCDEPCKWRNIRKTDAQGGTAWDNMMMGLRIGVNPQVCASTTPRPIKWLKAVMASNRTHVTQGTSYENRANLSAAWYENNIKPYEGTRLGMQELDAQIMDDTPGALWTNELIDQTRVDRAPDMKRIVIGVDPEAASNDESAETGIIVCGIGTDGHGYVLDDRTAHGTPAVWGAAVINAYHDWKADLIVPEVNNGGDMVSYVLRTIDQSVPIKTVHASRGKLTRGEPISALYEREMIHHVGCFPELESQMTTWVPGEKSPDRMDGMVWAFTNLMLGPNFTWDLL